MDATYIIRGPPLLQCRKSLYSTIWSEFFVLYYDIPSLLPFDRSKGCFSVVVWVWWTCFFKMVRPFRSPTARSLPAGPTNWYQTRPGKAMSRLAISLGRFRTQSWTRYQSKIRNAYDHPVSELGCLSSAWEGWIVWRFRRLGASDLTWRLKDRRLLTPIHSLMTASA